MNIFALPGYSVKLVKPHKLLEHQKIYTINHTDVYSWGTKVYINELPDVEFSPDDFSEVTPQSKDKDKMHPDWGTFHRGYGTL